MSQHGGILSDFLEDMSFTSLWYCDAAVFVGCVCELQDVCMHVRMQLS